MLRRPKPFLLALGLALCYPSFSITEAIYGASPWATLINQARPQNLALSSLGVTRKATAIPCFIDPTAAIHTDFRVRLLLVSGLDGSRDSVHATLELANWFTQSAAASELRSRCVLSVVPCVNMDGLAENLGISNGVGGVPSRGYPPPRKAAYHNPTDPERSYLWRWIGMHAPDLVLEVRAAPQDGNSFEQAGPNAWAIPREDANDSLVRQLSIASPADTGAIPAGVLRTGKSVSTEQRVKLFGAVIANYQGKASGARLELQRRLKRGPLTVAKELSGHYGHELKNVVYIPAVALIGRLRLGQLTDDSAQFSQVAKIVGPYFRGETPTAPKSGSGLSGHLVFCELAVRSRGATRQRYVELARKAADLAFDGQGNIRPEMPYHVEMSDAVFMGGPILARVGQLTGDARYYAACVQHLEFMKRLDLRKDGLYRHSPLDPAAWGRGNGFPAIGVAMCLSALPASHPDRNQLLAAFRNHLTALAGHQDYTGCWHQVIDRPESYRELTSTCMITFAMIRGVRSGWLDRERYTPHIKRAWYAIRTRIGSAGHLVDVCTGTGKQSNLRAYYDRPAILGRDNRGGAMALLVATELAAWVGPSGQIE
ncbi:MAG: glycoside hydrolase family 88 protein [Planctomycetota bacterium]|nr:glycoside hydrolase family 88 protein [Planctomycetota bacterium]